MTSTIDHPWWSHIQGAFVSLDPNATETHYNVGGVRMMLSEEVLQDAEGMLVKATIKRRPIPKEPVDVMTLKLDRGDLFFHGREKGGAGPYIILSQLIPKNNNMFKLHSY